MTDLPADLAPNDSFVVQPRGRMNMGNRTWALLCHPPVEEAFKG